MKRLLYVVLLIAGAVALPVVPAEAATCEGVTVVVQFQNGPVHVGCAPGNPSSGYDALTAAGFTFTYVPNQGGAICRIDGQPTSESTCWGSTYWSYWHAAPGKSWTYATTGASYDPAPGAFEGWHFGDGTSGPKYQVPAAPTPTPKPSAHPTAADSNPVVKPAATGRATPGGVPTAPDATTSAETEGPPAAGVTATATDSSPGNPPTANDVTTIGKPTSAPVNASSDSNGVSWIWGALLVVVLGAAGVFTAVRRRRS